MAPWAECPHSEVRVNEERVHERRERRCPSRQSYRRSGPLVCAQCGDISPPRAPGWHGYRTDEPSTDDVPNIAFYCPFCVAREFGVG